MSDKIEKTVSMAEAAPSVCPILDLKEIKGGTFLSKTFCIDVASTLSLFGVPVPCVLMKSISRFSSLDIFNAFSIAEVGPTPVSESEDG